MRRLLRGCSLAFALILAGAQAHAIVFINEIHYDNAGTDAGEAIELAGTAGTDLTGWSTVLYNGANGLAYDTDPLAGLIPNLQNGFGVVVINYPVNGIQNGAPDGIALVDASSTVVQFLSYEGTFMATGGVANGMLSTNIGPFEIGSEPLGSSLQLTGTGSTYGDFVWQPFPTSTFGSVNTSQTFTGGYVVPEPGSLILLAGGLLTVVSRKRRASRRVAH